LQVFQHQEDIVVIVSERIAPDGSYENVGPSVTNAAEAIATVVRTKVGIVWTHWIEHYPFPPSKEIEPTFDQVTFIWDNRTNTYGSPQWKRLSKEKVEALIGESLD
jgi:hypothetical protein